MPSSAALELCMQKLWCSEPSESLSLSYSAFEVEATESGPET